MEVSLIVQCADFERCEFRLNQTLISNDSVLPTSCQTLSETDKRIWEDENDMLDKYFQTLDKAQTKLSQLSSIDWNLANECSDLSSFLSSRNDTEIENDAKFYLSYEIHSRYNVIDKADECNNVDGVAEYCNCMNQFRKEMIRWLTSCLNL